MIRAFARGAIVLAATLPASAAVVGVEVSRVPFAPALPLSLAAPSAAAPSFTYAPAFALSPALAPSAPESPLTPKPAAAPAAAPAAVPTSPMAIETVAPTRAIPVAEKIAAPAAAAPDAPSEEAASRAAERFDGSAPAAPAAVDAPRPPASKPGDGLIAADPADEEWLASVVLSLSRSRTGRRILREIAALAVERGHPTLVVVKAISNNGEFRYDSDLLVMDASHRKSDAALIAPIFAHELQHVLQRSRGLPVDALELEVESYTTENRVWSELGIEPRRGSFAAQARRRILADADEFTQWLIEQYKNNRMLYGGTTDAYAGWLAETGKKLDKREARAKKKLAAAKRVVEKMRAEGKPEEFVRSFVQDDVEPVERALRDLAVERAWNDRDRALLATPEGRERFRAYARAVMRRARALSRG